MDDACHLLLDAYRRGIFPMADSAAHDTVSFYRPINRALLPIDTLHIPRRLRRTLKQHPYQVTINHAFKTVIDACGEEHSGRPKTWINTPIKNIFIELHARGYAHSMECWTQDGVFAGGLYGLAIGRVFCGESMVSHARDASKIALVHLCARLSRGGFTLLDSQFINDHLKQFGVYEIPQEEYESRIESEMAKPADFILAGLSHDVLLRDYLIRYSGGDHVPNA